MYTNNNFRSKKELKAAVAAGEKVGVFQPNDMFNNTAKVQTGTHSISLEGPHYPEAHKWYASATVVDGIITSVK